MGGGVQDLPHIVFVLHLHAGHAAAALSLYPDIRRVHAFDVVLLGEGNGHGFVGHQVGNGEFFLGGGDFSSPVVAEVLLFVLQFFLHHVHDFVPAGKEVFQISNGFLHVLVVSLQFVSFQSGEAAETHIQDGGGLLVRQVELAHEGVLCDFIGSGFADGTDDFINMVQCNEQTFQDMGLGFGLIQFEAASSGNHFFLVFQVVVENLLQVQDTGVSVH